MNSPEDVPNPGSTPAAVEGITLPPLSKRDQVMDATVRFTPGSAPADRPAAPVPLDQQPASGCMVFKRYRLLHVLGRGGMGVVWLAEDTKLSRTVALKFLPDIIGTDPQALTELKEETRRGLDLAHPNIVRIYDFVDDEEAAAISMEFVNGKTLAELRLSRPHKMFTVAEISPWVREMCDALDYAHQQRQLVHRDLKPANLMVTADSHVKIADFGIARSMAETMTRVSLGQGTTSGTMLYMSPQQAMGDPPRPTDDVYSLGATLYELLTGKPPFFRGDIVAQVTAKTAPPLRERRAELNIIPPDDIPDDWEKAIAACLDKDPAFRPQSAGELAARLGLGAGADGKPYIVVVRPDETSATPGVAKSEAPARRTPKWVTRLATTAAALATVALFGWWWTGRPGEWAVQTYPQGAHVSIADVTQIAPARFAGLTPGRYQANILLEGFEPRALEFSVDAGQKVNIGVIKLTPMTVSGGDGEGDDFELKTVEATLVAPQPKVGEPPGGFWTFDELFLHSEYANYSENGRRYIFREAQRALKRRGHYKHEITDAPDVDFHRSLQSMQRLTQLQPTGLLDSATITAMGIVNIPDKADWTPASELAESEGWWARHVTHPLQRLFGE